MLADTRAAALLAAASLAAVLADTRAAALLARASAAAVLADAGPAAFLAAASLAAVLALFLFGTAAALAPRTRGRGVRHLCGIYVEISVTQQNADSASGRRGRRLRVGSAFFWHF